MRSWFRAPQLSVSNTGRYLQTRLPDGVCHWLELFHADAPEADTSSAASSATVTTSVRMTPRRGDLVLRPRPKRARAALAVCSPMFSPSRRSLCLQPLEHRVRRDHKGDLSRTGVYPELRLVVGCAWAA